MPRITFSHVSLDFEVPQDASFLEFCREHDAPQEFGCTVGSCGTCCIVIEQGAEHLAPVTDEERETIEMVTDEEGARLGCQMVVTGDLTLRPASR